MPTRLLLILLCLGASATATAQPLGVFRWQQQPYCNVLTVNVVQSGAVYQLDGTDDQCGAGTKASVSGLAFPNPNGTIGMGLAIVTTPGGQPLHLDATITLATIGGTWRDSTGNTGAFVFTPGAPVPGAVRPAPKPAFPAGLTVGGGTITGVAAPVAANDAVNKAYVDNGTAVVRSAILGDKTWSAFVNADGTKGGSGPFTSSSSAAGQYEVAFDLTGLAVPGGADFLTYVAVPRCSGFSAAFVAGRTLTSGGGILFRHSAGVTITNAAGVAANCAFFLTAVQPDPDTGSPLTPLQDRSGQSGVSCTTEGRSTTCVETGLPR